MYHVRIFLEKVCGRRETKSEEKTKTPLLITLIPAVQHVQAMQQLKPLDRESENNKNQTTWHPSRRSTFDMHRLINLDRDRSMPIACLPWCMITLIMTVVIALARACFHHVQIRVDIITTRSKIIQSCSLSEDDRGRSTCSCPLRSPALVGLRVLLGWWRILHWKN